MVAILKYTQSSIEKKYYPFSKIWHKTAEVFKLKIGKTRLKMPNEYVFQLEALNSQESQISFFYFSFEN